jgi:hypothetical protein
MIEFSATVRRYAENGDKTGWYFIDIPAGIAAELQPESRKAFRVKGFLDAHPIAQMTLLPSGDGAYILPVNGAMRKGTAKGEGAMLKVRLEPDASEVEIPEELAAGLSIDDEARAFFEALPKSHQRYWIKWVDAVKGAATRENRAARATAALAKGQGFAEMFHEEKALKEAMGGKKK